MTKLFSIAISPPGNSHVMVVIPDIECDHPEDAAEGAKGWVLAAIKALGPLHPSTWNTRVVSQTEVEDIEVHTP